MPLFRILATTTYVEQEELDIEADTQEEAEFQVAMLIKAGSCDRYVIGYESKIVD